MFSIHKWQGIKKTVRTVFSISYSYFTCTCRWFGKWEVDSLINALVGTSQFIATQKPPKIAAKWLVWISYFYEWRGIRVEKYFKVKSCVICSLLCFNRSWVLKMARKGSFLNWNSQQGLQHVQGAEAVSTKTEHGAQWCVLHSQKLKMVHSFWDSKQNTRMGLKSVRTTDCTDKQFPHRQAIFSSTCGMLVVECPNLWQGLRFP